MNPIEMMLFKMGVTSVLTTVQLFIKNPDSAKNFKSILLEIRDDINLLFPGE